MSARSRDLASAPLPNLSRKGVERGHMLCVSHLSWIIVFIFSFSVKRDGGAVSSGFIMCGVIQDDHDTVLVFNSSGAWELKKYVGQPLADVVD